MNNTTKQNGLGFFGIAYPNLKKPHVREIMEAPPGSLTRLMVGGKVVTDGGIRYERGRWMRVKKAYSITGAGNTSEIMSVREKFNRAPVSLQNPAWAAKLAHLWINHASNGDFDHFDGTHFQGTVQDASGVLMQSQVADIIRDLSMLQWRPNGSLPPKGHFPLYQREFMERAFELAQTTSDRVWVNLKWPSTIQTTRFVKRVTQYKPRKVNPEGFVKDPFTFRTQEEISNPSRDYAPKLKGRKIVKTS